MLILILTLVVSLIPIVVILLLLRNKGVRDDALRKICDKAFLTGLFSIIPIIFLSGITNILVNLMGFRENNPLLYQALYTFLVLALAEEIVKFLMSKRVIKKNDYPYSWMDVTIIVTIVAIGFSLIESLTYAIGASVPVLLARGISLPHVGYGFLVGYFYGKSKKTGNPIHFWIGFILAWLQHGLYDFSLSEEFLALNEYLVFVPFILIVIDIALAVTLVVFALKGKNKEKYTEPLS